MLKNKLGVSLISLIITIIATIILASITIYSSLSAPKSATFSKFVDEVSSIRTALGIIRNNNIMDYGDANQGFKKVTIENGPDRFISFPNSSGDVVGYVVDVSKIGIPEIKRGYGSCSGEITFGIEDVFVYDKNGTVFYVQGFANDGKIYYNSSSYVEE